MNNTNDPGRTIQYHRLHFVSALRIEGDELVKFIEESLIKADIKETRTLTLKDARMIDITYRVKKINSAIAIVSLSTPERFYALYPMILYVAPNRIFLNKINILDDVGIEATVEGKYLFPPTKDGEDTDEFAPSLEFFAVDYFKNNKIYIEKNASFVSLSGIAYGITPPRTDINHAFTKLSLMDPTFKDYKSDDFWFQGKILEIIEIENGNKIFKLEFSPLHALYIYISSQTLKKEDYKVNDIISGGMWVQGSMSQEIQKVALAT